MSSLRTISACIRNELRAGNYYPIKIVKGDAAPHFRGNGWRYETKGGRPIYHPSAYSKVGWSNMVYKHSTRRIEVGHEFILNNYRHIKRYRNDIMILQSVKIKLPVFT